nr:MAG TPA: hypothetical protein [Caudoviricetes sp.]
MDFCKKEYKTKNHDVKENQWNGRKKRSYQR